MRQLIYNPSFNVVVLIFICLSAGIAAHSQTLNRDPIISEIESIVKSEMAKGQVAGISIGVARGKKTLVLKGYGRANIELDVRTPDERAVYEIASIGKTFTAVAIMLLVEQGKLSLDDPVAKHLPGVLAADIGGKVTIRHLLTHTSGIRDYLAIPEFQPLLSQDRPREELIKLVAAQPLQYEPGTRMMYSNAGFFFLGMVIEQVSGVLWRSTLRKNYSDVPV